MFTYLYQDRLKLQSWCRPRLEMSQWEQTKGKKSLNKPSLFFAKFLSILRAHDYQGFFNMKGK